MASIKKIEGKTGTSYKITVTKGVDSSGKQIRHFKTWTPDRPMTARQMEKEVQKVALDFEREIDLGFQADNRQTFDQYAKYVIETKELQGLAKNTVSHYKKFASKVSPFIGHMKLSDIRPQHINSLYRELGKPEAREILDTFKKKGNLTKAIEATGTNRYAFAAKCGLHDEAIYRACRGCGVKRENAEKIANAIGKPMRELFAPAHTPTKLSPNSIRRLHSFVSCVFSQAVKEMLIPYNPASKATPPATIKPEPKYLQPEQVAAILEALEGEPIKYKTMVHLLAVTGMRKGEEAALRWEKIDLENGQIKVDRSLTYLSDSGITDGPTKGKNTRFVAIPSETVSLLKKYRVWQTERRLMMGDSWTDTGYVFTRDNGLPMNPSMVSDFLRSFCRRHNLPHVNAHAFRHSYASILIAEGTDVVTVSQALGHSKTSITTDIYAHIIEDSKRRASECVADVILRKKKA